MSITAPSKDGKSPDALLWSRSVEKSPCVMENLSARREEADSCVAKPALSNAKQQIKMHGQIRPRPLPRKGRINLCYHRHFHHGLQPFHHCSKHRKENLLILS